MVKTLRHPRKIAASIAQVGTQRLEAYEMHSDPATMACVAHTVLRWKLRMVGFITAIVLTPYKKRERESFKTRDKEDQAGTRMSLGVLKL